MKKKSTFLLFSLAVLLSSFLISQASFAQTAGNLNFSMSFTSHSGGYGAMHVVSIWLENGTGTFVKTKYRYASGHTLSSHLPVWKANSASNIVDATVGTTLTSYSPVSITWNATNVSAALVADGDYKVMMEITWDDGTANHDTASVTFTKGPSGVHLTPANFTNFTGITLDWVPSGVGINENFGKETFSVTPNPISNVSTVNYSLTENSDVTVSLYDVTGKLINVLYDANQTAGTYNLPLNVKGKVKQGVYFLKMYTGKSQHTERIIVTE